MPNVSVVIEGSMSQTIRARQMAAAFDVPIAEKTRLEWQFDAPFDQRTWNVGLITGPSGCGKTTIARHLFGSEALADPLIWGTSSVVDDFPADCTVEQISTICQSVGFNTIPAWMRPYDVLSNGEKFRVTLARRLIEHQSDEALILDEFTSVVDRQVARIGSHALQKYIRKNNRKFVAITCHSDVIDWLQPDWVINPATKEFHWRQVQRRPEINITIGPVPYAAWHLFAPYHYLTSSLHIAARCWGLWVDDQLAAFCGVLHRPMNKRQSDRPVYGDSRLVTLPDYQGLGLAFILSEYIGSVYKSVGCYFHNYPAHPSFIRAHDRSPNWQMLKKPGQISPKEGATSRIKGLTKQRPCAVFRYVGPAADPIEAKRLLSYWNKI